MTLIKVPRDGRSEEFDFHSSALLSPISSLRLGQKYFETETLSVNTLARVFSWETALLTT